MESIRNDFTLHATTIEEATQLLNRDTEQGLTIEKAKERLEHFGLNTIEEAKAISKFWLANSKVLLFFCIIQAAKFLKLFSIKNSQSRIK